MERREGRYVLIIEKNFPFGNKKKKFLFAEIPNGKEMIVGSLLLKNLQLLQFNAHEFFETRVNPNHRFRGSKPIYLGVAIYPTVARFNHDCYPAVTR